jgi:hypothetical protein
MGHERVGILPKTERWNRLVDRMGGVYASEVPVGALAAQTLQNVRQRYEALFQDDAVKSAFAFLVKFSHACRSEDPHEALRASGIPMAERATLLSIVRALKEQIPSHQAATEYGQITIGAAADAIGNWYKQNASQQMPLFKPSSEFLDSWRPLGDGSGFCELSRLFFGKVTERYLNYFLERAASATCPSLEHRERLQEGIRSHVDAVSQHAFETAKITQSFAAGWFNGHARDKVPDDREIEGFLSVAFGKMRDELRREELAT